MLARYGGAFGMSAAIHAAIVVALVWTTYVPPLGRRQPERQVEVVLLPPSEDTQFPGLKPVERSRGAAPSGLEEEDPHLGVLA